MAVVLGKNGNARLAFEGSLESMTRSATAWFRGRYEPGAGESPRAWSCPVVPTLRNDGNITKAVRSINIRYPLFVTRYKDKVVDVADLSGSIVHRHGLMHTKTRRGAEGSTFIILSGVKRVGVPNQYCIRWMMMWGRVNPGQSHLNCLQPETSKVILSQAAYCSKIIS